VESTGGQSQETGAGRGKTEQLKVLGIGCQTTDLRF
jgi:hypothetical protein